MLLEVARKAHCLADGTCEHMDGALTVNAEEFDELCNALNALDELPELDPPYVAGCGASRAKVALYPVGVTDWAGEIKKERERQVSEEGWASEHDDKHTDCSIANAAACYATSYRELMVRTSSENDPLGLRDHYETVWPWHEYWNKKYQHDRKRQLVIAGALILAELERLERIEKAKENT